MYWIALILALLLVGCAGGPASAPVDHRQTAQGRTVYREAQPLSDVAYEDQRASAPLRNTDWHTVVKGDTLYSIAFQHNLDIEDVAAWNGLRDPYLIRIGEQLRLNTPQGFAKPPMNVSTRKVASTPKHKPVAKPVTKPKPAHSAKQIAKPVPATKKPVSSPKRTTTKTKSRPSSVASGPLKWRWPTKGKLIKRYSTRGTSKRGITIAGKPGQIIRAAAQGRVVYAGSGLVGYGKLVIIKHDKTTLSAYGHNRKLLVSEGDVVASGDPVAEMGSSDAPDTRLHFEVRKRGKPVNPMRYLPRR